jgi:hypothetical protein
MQMAMDTRSGIKRKRHAVPGSEWSDEELKFFKIQIELVQRFEDFFETRPPENEEELNSFFIEANERKRKNIVNDITKLLELDISRVDAFEDIDLNIIESDNVLAFIKDIHAVTKTHKSQESAVDDFAKTMFHIFHYDYGDRCIRTREELVLEMCGKTTGAKPDLCIETMNSSIKLMVQEDKNYNVANGNFLGSNPEAQVIAEAIAAFQNNSKMRTGRIAGLYPVIKQLIPCITLLGTYPTFYLFEVTTELAEAVKNGEEPSKETIVRKYQVPLLSVPLGDAMLSQKYKPKIFHCYAAFRKFLA